MVSRTGINIYIPAIFYGGQKLHGFFVLYGYCTALTHMSCRIHVRFTFMFVTFCFINDMSIDLFVYRRRGTRE